MDPVLLRSFVETADTGAMSRAAERLRLAQPSLTLQIQRLERHLGVTLFRRHGRGVALTEAGHALYPRARRILDEVRSAEDVLRGAGRAARAPLRVGAIPTVAPYVLPGALQHWRERHARRVEIREDYSAALERQLLDGALDVVLAAQPFPFEHVDIEIVGSEALLVAVPSSHPAALAGRITLAQLRDAPAVTLDAAHCLGEQVAGFCSSRQVMSAVVCRSAQLATVVELVAAGVGVSIVPAMAAARYAASACAFVPLADQSLTRDLVAAWRPRRPRTAAARAFVDGVREVLRAR
jgi:LysR family hydrogen peroxide-inducible transcriptional activator